VHLFITGISGFVGLRLARWVRERGGRASGIYVADRPAPDVGDCWEADLLDLPALEAALDAARPDAVVHLGALSHVGASWQRMGEYFRVNVLGTEAVLDAAGGAPVLLASSAEVYGVVPEDEQPLGEERLPAPSSPYALTKAAAERLALRAGGLVIRLFNLVGPRQARDFALPAFASQLAAIAAGRQAPRLGVGNLEARRDFVHVADGAEAIALLAERGAAGGTYNVASGSVCSIREALDRLLAVSGVEVEVFLDERYLRPVDIPVLRGSAGPLRALGWEPRRGMDRAIADLWQWSVESAAVEASR
jgi:GDP-4-dehydro-6-deoxy-D-mannose reductase